jgi:TRAP-type C4-dicarboxylate transport system substrate-binding protein
MKKKAGFILSVIILVGVFLLGTYATAAPKPSAEPVKLSFGHIWSTTSWYHGVFAEWAKRIEKGTNGSIKFVMYPAKSLAKPKEYYKMTVMGGADSCIGLPGWVVGRFPLTLVVESPPCFPLGADSGPLYWELYKTQKPLQEEWREVKMIFVTAQTAQHLMLKKPVHTLEELKGMEIRTYGPTTAIVEALGGVPVAMPITEAYVALKKGVVSGIMGPWATLDTYKFSEVTSYGIELNAQAAIFVGIMNLKRWNALSPEQQRVIMENGDWIAKEFGKKYDAGSKKAYDRALKAGFKMIKLDPQEMKKWTKRIDSTTESYIKKIEAKGLPGRQVYDAKLKLMKR